MTSKNTTPLVERFAKEKYYFPEHERCPICDDRFQQARKEVEEKFNLMLSEVHEIHIMTNNCECDIIDKFKSDLMRLLFGEGK